MNRIFALSLLIGIASFIFYVVVIVKGSPSLFNHAYWALITFFWLPAITTKVLSFKKNKVSNDFKRQTFISPSFVMGFIGVICSLISFFAFPFARSYDKTASIFSLISIIQPLAFLYFHAKTEIKGAIYKSMNRVLCYLVYSVQIFFGSLFVLIQIGATFQAVGLAQDAQSFPPPGILVPLPELGYSLHLSCYGKKLNESDPIIWFEHGLGGSSLDFEWVRKNVSTYAKTCSYDHAGLGWSDIPVYPRTTEQIVMELKQLLPAAGIKDDLLMVGHSMAGYNTRVAQRLITTNRIVGITLVDPVDTQWPNCVEGLVQTGNILFSLAHHLAPIGLVRLLSKTSFSLFQSFKQLESANAYVSNLMLTWNLITRSSESSYFPSSCGYTKRIATQFSPPIYSNTTKLLQLNPSNPTADETWQGIPYGVVFALRDDAVNAQGMARLAKDVIAINSTLSSHTSILFIEEEAKIVSGLVKNIWDLVLAGKDKV